MRTERRHLTKDDGRDVIITKERVNETGLFLLRPDNIYVVRMRLYVGGKNERHWYLFDNMDLS
jgi:hypothetical protein